MHVGLLNYAKRYIISEISWLLIKSGHFFEKLFTGCEWCRIYNIALNYDSHWILSKSGRHQTVFLYGDLKGKYTWNAHLVWEMVQKMITSFWRKVFMTWCKFQSSRIRKPYKFWRRRVSQEKSLIYTSLYIDESLLIGNPKVIWNCSKRIHWFECWGWFTWQFVMWNEIFTRQKESVALTAIFCWVLEKEIWRKSYGCQ